MRQVKSAHLINGLPALSPLEGQPGKRSAEPAAESASNKAQKSGSNKAAAGVFLSWV